MKVFGREHRPGQKMILEPGNGEEAEIGAFRQTPRGYDAFAKAFVESFQPWSLYVGNVDVEFDRTAIQGLKSFRRFQF